VSQKYEYKLFIFEYSQGNLTTQRKYRNIHSSSRLSTDLITDMRLSGSTLLTVGRDKRVNTYSIKFN